MRMLTSTLATLVLCAVTTVPAHSFDLTGHWIGKWSCKGFSAPYVRDGKLVNGFAPANPASTLAITQNDGAFGAVIDLNEGESYRYNGFAMESVKGAGSGEVFLLRCGTGQTPVPSGGEIVRAAVKTKGGVVKASFKGVSLVADDYPEITSCKYSYTRIDTVDPAVESCP